MIQGGIRDWEQNEDTFWNAFNGAVAARGDKEAGKRAGRQAMKAFRRGYSAAVFSAKTGEAQLGSLSWGTPVELPSFAFGSDQRIEVISQTGSGPLQGWVDRSAVAVHGFVTRTDSAAELIANPEELKVSFRKSASASGSTKVHLLWGDMVQIIRKQGSWLRVSARGFLGRVKVTEIALVNVRTDGELIMCASQSDSAEGWVIHAFKARFG